jgi:ubiquinone/menaquinone biosynthesis C-methylase UbiE
MPYLAESNSSERIYDDINTQLSRTRYTHLHDFIHTEEKKFWEEYGSFYKYLERADAYQELVSDFEKLLPDALGGTWVDLGSGSGQIVEFLASRREASASIIASDHNETMLSQLRTRVPSGVGVREIDLVHQLPFENGSLDGVTANLVLSYVVHHQGKFGNAAFRALLMDIHRSLKPGGTLVWSTPKLKVHFIMTFFASFHSIMRSDQRENIRYGWRILRQALRIEEKGRRGVYHFLSPGDLVRMLEEIGFKNIRVSRTMARQVNLIRCER